MGNIVTRFTERFGCKHPFACAGMAFAGMTDLALAVCRGGGVGAIGVGLMPAEQLRAMIHEMRKQTTAPFNVNLITCFDFSVAFPVRYGDDLIRMFSRLAPTRAAMPG